MATTMTTTRPERDRRPSRVDRPPVIITGAARSGTRFLSKLARAGGVRSTHEGLDPAALIDVDSGLGHVLADTIEARGVRVVGHVVREPHHVVGSIVGRGMWYGPWGARQEVIYPATALPELKDGRDIDRSLAYWIAHNTAITAACEAYGSRIFALIFPIDHALEALEALCDAAGFPFNLEAAAREAAKLGTTDHTIPESPPYGYDWNDHRPALRAVAEGLANVYRISDE
jgi:hypothetical protein